MAGGAGDRLRHRSGRDRGDGGECRDQPDPAGPRAAPRLELAVAAGLAHRRLQARAPYDLIIANILAGPLIDLAPARWPAALAPGGRLILAGLLDHQAATVAAAYRAPGPDGSPACIERGDWPTLVMRKRRRAG